MIAKARDSYDEFDAWGPVFVYSGEGGTNEDREAIHVYLQRSCRNPTNILYEYADLCFVHGPTVTYCTLKPEDLRELARFLNDYADFLQGTYHEPD